jgi:hypothetical protein
MISLITDKRPVKRTDHIWFQCNWSIIERQEVARNYQLTLSQMNWFMRANECKLKCYGFAKIDII